MKRAKVSELKARLSSYLADVRSGDTVVVCERATPIARLAPLEENAGGFKISEARRPIKELASVRAVRLRKNIDIDKVLSQLRGER